MTLLSKRLVPTFRSRCLNSFVNRPKCTNPFRLTHPQPVSPLRRASTAPVPRPVLSNTLRYAVASTVVLGLASYALYSSPTVHAEAPPETEIQPPSDSPRKIRLDEVRNHGPESDNPWIMRGNRVYDITEWIPIHPGGDVIRRGAGGAVEGFWKIFSIHQKQEVYDILEQYFIGVIDERDLRDGKVPEEDIEDPFVNDPRRDPRLHALTERPCNAETPGPVLTDFITPNELFYVRNHMWVPEVTDPDQHKLTIELPDGEEKVYTLGELRTKFTSHTITAVLQCSGNRRSHMTQGARHTNGLQWDVGAIGNANWTGIKLRDVLADAGFDVDDVPDDVKHAQFMGSEAYGASIPIHKAVDRHGDVLLAYAMNGEPLPRDHGFPLRVLVPGNVAARSVKWVNRITLSDEESWSQWQRRDYKCFGPNEGSKPNWDAAVSIQEMPVQSAITCVRNISGKAPNSGAGRRPSAYPYTQPEEDSVVIEGYAFSGGGRRIVRVDISADDGHTWDQAELILGTPLGSKSWGWARWRYTIPRRQIAKFFLVKAVDEAYNTQPNEFASHYNYRGNLASGWHRMPYEQPD